MRPLTGWRTPRVFLSYRRADSAGTAGRIFDRLAASMGDDAVFLDVADMPLGDDYLARLQKEIKSADFVLVVIGKYWLNAAGPDGRRRIDDPADVVHWEIRTALSEGVRVVPLLVDGAAMPSANDVPADLRAFTLCSAAEVTHTLFEESIGHVLKQIGAPAEKRVSGKTWLYLVLIAVALTLATRFAFSLSMTTSGGIFDASDTMFTFLLWLVIAIVTRWLVARVLRRRLS